MTGFWLIQKPSISSIENFLSVFAVFSQFGRYAHSCPFCTLPRVPLGTTYSQESLVIIIYIKTASHKIFSIHGIAVFGINQYHVITLKNFCD